MDVAAGDGERDGRDTTVQALYAARVGATSGENLHLVGDVLALGDGAEVLHQLRMGDGVAVHDLDGHTLAQLGYGVLVASAWNIHRERHVERDDDRRFQGRTAGFRAAQADLFLRGGGGEDGRLVISHGPQRLEHHEDADAVVHRLADVVLPDLLQGTVHDHVVPDAHLLLYGLRVHTQVDVELIGLRRFLLLAARQMRWLARRLERAAERLAIGGRYEDPLRDHVRRVVAAQGLQAEEALVVDVFDEVADLVGVGGDHHAGVVASLFRPDHTPKGVGADLVRQRAQLLACDLPLPFLPPGDAGRLDQPPQ